MVRISDIAKYEGQTVELKGWLYNKRSSKKIHFLQVRDGSGIIQAIAVKGEVSDACFDTCGELSQETSVAVKGMVREDKRSPLGYEIGITDLTLIGASNDYPITPKDHGVAFLMDHRHLWLRSRRQQAIMQIRNELIYAIRTYFYEKGFLLVDAPIFTPAACEGTTNLFETQYFDTQAYLTQSGQLYMEAGATAFGKVFCFGPTFRAEKSKTRRHLTEFWMIEPEVAFADLAENMVLAEDFIVSIVSRVLEKQRANLEVLERDISKLENIQKPFPRITYDEAVKILQAQGKDIKWGEDFGGDEETVLTQQFDRPVIVHRYPTEIKAFYMKKDQEDPKRSLSMDILAPEGYGEIIGGGQREENLAVLEESLKKHGLPREAFEWYLDLRRYGSVPHSGFGLGLERTLSWICGLHHVRETIPFPRMMERLSP